VEKEYLLTRAGASVGDAILVTGKFGGPATLKFDSRKWKVENRTQEARIIAKSRMATSMIDSSDGLVRSVIEICKASKVGARIRLDSVPVAKGANVDQALYGVEEYELVFTMPKNRIGKIKMSLTEVGEIVPENKGVKLVDSYGKIKPLRSGGYEHFR
jgi:thiamine-monophosphate kinase